MQQRFVVVGEELLWECEAGVGEEKKSIDPSRERSLDQWIELQDQRVKG